ncbi:hypothetical protein SAMN05192583_1087 [Sphingomonas gellani]|uniref:Uncharacterized protein n=1 Tax=Sphingomonas gellani TaxID=1166340 RepID=A0A1H8AYC0_9SPHN|nr:hypothetical protein [Sphingomonas gellani]SEM74859.1 hypothetical protein SAMN05192583_1087 [Sphingomonas gellani]
MELSSPWAKWDPTQPGSLTPRANDQRVILSEDLMLILENTPDCVPDATLREYLLRALHGELRKPTGRPVSKLSHAMLRIADIWIELEAEDIRAERAADPTKRMRGDLEPMKLAADRVAPRFGSISRNHLLNEISRMKTTHL